MFKCPYCHQDSYAKSSKKKGKFESWDSVRHHLVHCKFKTGEYCIDLINGPIHIDSIKNIKYTKCLKLDSRLSDFKKCFKRRGLDSGSHVLIYTKECLLNLIKEFYRNHNRIPQYRDFNKNTLLPGGATYQRHFGSWNNAIKAAGFEPDINNGFGIKTIAKDGILYRSKSEAYFVDTFLYEKYDYEYEPEYDNSNKFYDFYIKELDLYIELDGECRPPEIIEEKIQINKQENKNLLVIRTKDIYNKKELKEFMLAAICV